MDKTKEKKIYYAHDLYRKGIYLLIPKKRGNGFLKTPVWHVNNDLSCFIQYELEFDCWGLDGYLYINTGFNWPDKAESGIPYNAVTESVREEIVEKIAQFLGFEKHRVSQDKIFDYLLKKESIIS